MSLYRQPIILFGIALPLLASAALVGIAATLKSQVVDSFNAKEKSAKAATLTALATRAIESEVNLQQPKMQRWNAQLALETKSLVNKNIKEIAEHLPSRELIINAAFPSATKAGFGSVSAQNSSQVSVSCRATFRTMQRALLELETRMPQLQAGALKIVPNPTQSSLLNFQVNYTAWEN
jgi:hypothetical protein